MKINLSGMTRKQLEKLRGDVDNALKDVVSRDRKEARKAAAQAAAKFGFSLDDLNGGAGGGAKRAKKPAGVAKFANPADPSQTWTGKGRQPQWYKDAVAKGTDPKKLAI